VSRAVAGRELALLLRILDEAYDRKAWHGPNLKGALRGVSAEQAAWAPGPGRHSVRDLARHAAYWKYACRRRLTGEKRGSFRLPGSNWFPSPEKPTEKGWRSDLALLEDEHRRLRAVVADLRPERLHEVSPGSRHRVDTLIYGIAAHDTYHAGQIQLVKRLYAAGRTRGRRV
jgi:uncharacterized damage-inducible protein DinB